MEIKNSNEQKNEKSKGEFNFRIKVLLSIFILLAIFVFSALIAQFKRIDYAMPITPYIIPKPDVKNADDIKKFSSERDFRDYMENSSELAANYSGRAMMNFRIADQKEMLDRIYGNANSIPDRVSGTNVQVIGIDEPDIVKTDGKNIYFSGQQRFYPMMRNDVNSGISFEEQQRMEQKMIVPYHPIPQSETKIIKAFPPAELAAIGKIDKQGDLLLDKNTLVVFPSSNYYYGAKREITGYNVSNSQSPEKKWNIKLDNNTSIVTSRLRDSKIYLITRNNINTPSPCPIKPLSVDDLPIIIPCTEIYHPIVPVPVDSTFTAMILDPATGKISDKISFVGSSGQSVVYVSENAIYATYIYNESIAKFFSGFVSENKNLFPSWLSQKTFKLESYDISEDSKLLEIEQLLAKYNNSLNDDERLKAQNEFTNRMSDYYKRHSRDLEKTGIIKINLDKFQVAANGTIPGHLLNNFSMDEYKGNFRLATTIGSRWGFWNGIGNSESFSDVYVLDKDLKTLGSVKDLGKTEQIYSVRFVEDKGYVVTFRQTDPFYVIDLVNPKSPQMAGELKIPGFSSYLHPLDATHILGIGQEGSQVKISLFDVSDKNNPIELDKYLLDEYWSEVSNNYHAFLLDTKHNIFFLPGSKGGYVFSYYPTLSECDTVPINGRCSSSSRNPIIRLQKAVSQNSVKRAIYINDYLYIIGEDKITVLNELNWGKVNELNLQ